MLAVMTMIMTMILTMVMILMKRRVLFHKPAPHRASRWGWKDPLCPAQNRSQSPEKDQLCHHHDSEDSPEVIFGDIFEPADPSTVGLFHLLHIPRHTLGS